MWEKQREKQAGEKEYLAEPKAPQKPSQQNASTDATANHPSLPATHTRSSANQSMQANRPGHWLRMS
jgi:hypothetical protein